MRLLDLIEQQHSIGSAAYDLGQITALLVTDITGRRANQSSNRMLLHELGHIDSNHGLFGIEQEFGQRFAQFGLADTGRAEKQERAIRSIRVRQAGAGTTHCIRYSLHRFILTNHTLMQCMFHSQQLFSLALEHFRHRDACPL